jgi:hypothetical protein
MSLKWNSIKYKHGTDRKQEFPFPFPFLFPSRILVTPNKLHTHFEKCLELRIGVLTKKVQTITTTFSSQTQTQLQTIHGTKTPLQLAIKSRYYRGLI